MSDVARGSVRNRVTAVVRSPRLWVGVAIIGVIVVVGWLGVLTRTVRELEANLETQQWGKAIADANQDLDPVQPTVGVIQFMKNGFSISFDTAEYSPAGLHLTGTVGNPKNVIVSSMTLKIEAWRPAYLERGNQKFDWFAFFSRKPVAVGQATVGYIPPGSEGRFGLTLATLTQAKSDSVQLSAGFTGERYVYPR